MIRTLVAKSNLPPSGRVLVLFGLLAGRLLFHALYVPAYEGPDEPFHLGRAVVFADESWRSGLEGDRLPGAIAASISGHPCCAALSQAFPCAPFGGNGAFNILSKSSNARRENTVVNYEAHQPPLFYALAGTLLRTTRAVFSSPESRLLALRLVSVLLVLTALAFQIRSLARDRGEAFAAVFLLFLLLPGASEALARGSNDAALFLWTALVIERMAHGARTRDMLLLLTLGPLLKLTAFPIVAVATTALWLKRRRVAAAAGALASLSVIGLQALRGWSWGGTYELNQLGWVPDSIRSFAVGLVRSIYTFVKTVFWLGEWSFFRAPLILNLMWFVLLSVAAASEIRRRREEARVAAPVPSESLSGRANAAGVLFVVGGFLTMAVLNRKLFGQWGGLGGWYAWGWAPWLAVSFGPSVADRLPRFQLALGLFVLLANVLWFRSAVALYGI